MSLKLVVVALVIFTASVYGQHDAYTPSGPARVGATGKPQLVEFYHPL